jgi:drug/metabolite transporter (DMT)-like permease
MNPVVAVFLGAIFLGERITPLILLGMALIVAGVAGLSLDGTGTSENGHSG